MVADFLRYSEPRWRLHKYVSEFEEKRENACWAPGGDIAFKKEALKLGLLFRITTLSKFSYA
jgi:hypothetical protein